jgi:hypothetical protein
VLTVPSPLRENESMELRGDKVVLRPVTDGDTEILERVVREPEVAAWWSPPDDYEGMLAAVSEGEVIGAVQFHEETDPEFRHAGVDIFLTARCHGKGLGAPTPRRSAATARSASNLWGSCERTGTTIGRATGRTVC